MPSAAEGIRGGKGGPLRRAESTEQSTHPAWTLVAAPALLAALASVVVLVLASDISARAAAYPRALAILLLIVGLWCLGSDLAGLRHRSAEGTEDANSEYGALHAGRIGAFALLAVVAVWLIAPLGFFPAAGLLLVGGLVILGIRSPLRIAGYTLVVITLSFVLFVQILRVPLPLAGGF